MQYIERPTNSVQRTLDRLPILGDVLRQPLGVIGFAIVLAFVIAVVFAPLIAPYDYARQDIPHRMQGPSAAYWLGTDHLGRDILSRIIYGSRVSLIVGFAAVIIGGAIGNAIDRFAYGAVADFVLFHVTTASFSFKWYVFNLADVAIVAGVIGLLYETLMGNDAAKAP